MVSKFSKLFIGALAITTAASGQELTEKKTALIQKAFPDAFSSVQLRHELQRNMDGDEVTGSTPAVVGRFYLGSKFFDGFMKSTFRSIVTKKAQNDQIDSVQNKLYNSFTIISTDNGKIVPYANIVFADGNTADDKTTYEIGNYAEASLSIPTSDLTLSLSTGMEALGYFGSKNSEAEVSNYDSSRFDDERNNALSLTADKDAGTAKADTDAARFTTEYNVSASIKPNVVPGLSFGMTTYFTRKFTPTMKVVENDAGTESTTFDRYKPETSSTNLYLISYKVTDQLTLANELYQYFDGVYESRVSGDTRWENVAAIKYTLF